MIRPALVLRPPPGDAKTAERLAAANIPVIRMPLFAIVPVPWAVPKDEFDALLLTSANAARHAGAPLRLPTIAVGKATADAARHAGYNVVAVGDGDAATALMLAHERGWRRVIRLAGRERTPLDGVTDAVVYASKARPVPPDALWIAEGAVALLHSTRAARRFVDLVDRDAVARDTVRLAAISAKVAAAAGAGWAEVAIAAAPDDGALVRAAAILAIDP